LRSSKLSSKLIKLTFKFYRFQHKNPEDQTQVPNGFISDCNSDTLTIKRALADKYIKGSKPLTQYQFERVGFFAVDTDSTSDKVSVLNKLMLFAVNIVAIINELVLHFH